MISEEDEEIIVGNPEGQYGIAFDPLDGFVLMSSDIPQQWFNG